jgi:hypothetical protein
MKDLIEYLKKYQAWRRGEDERSMEEADIKPKELVEKLDEAIKCLELMSKHSDLAALKKLAARQVAYEDASDITDAIHEIAALRCYRENHTELMERLRTMHRERYEHDAEVIEKAIESIDGYMTVSQALHSKYAAGWNDALKGLENYANQLRQKAQDVE